MYPTYNLGRQVCALKCPPGPVSCADSYVRICQKKADVNECVGDVDTDGTLWVTVFEERGVLLTETLV